MQKAHSPYPTDPHRAFSAAHLYIDVNHNAVLLGTRGLVDLGSRVYTEIMALLVWLRESSRPGTLLTQLSGRVRARWATAKAEKDY